jgi:hypothetical protein
MAWFEFDQNNSGGSFDIDPQCGLGPRVWIEAIDYADANDRAEALGIYFDGCENERDCDCCGDRWYRQYDEGEELPVILEDYAFSWHPQVYLHSRDGRIHVCRADNYQQVIAGLESNIAVGHA